MKVLVLVATGFEDVELIATLDIFARNEIEYDLVSPENKSEVKGKFSAKVDTIKIEDLNLHQYDGIFLPGGPGVDIMLKSYDVKLAVEHFTNTNKVISAICAAPKILDRLRILDDKKFTAYPGTVDSKNNTGKNVQRDGNLITGKDFKATIDFAEEVVKQLIKNCK